MKNMSKPCTCSLCLERINSVPSDPYLSAFRRMLLTGQIQHIDTVNGKPVYRQW
jgi:hypothetical protein